YVYSAAPVRARPSFPTRRSSDLTANVVLGTAFGLAEGIAVDTHVRRLSGRLGLTKHEDPVKIERDLMAIVPRQGWSDFSHRLIRSEEHTSELQSLAYLVCRLLLE